MQHYLDHNATSPLRPEARGAMLAFWDSGAGNASSVHRDGVAARYALEKARRAIARALGCAAERLVMVGGGTESDNLAIRGAAMRRRRERGHAHIVTSAAEHKAVLDTCISLRDLHGFDATILPVDEWGRTRPDDLRRAVRPDTALVSIMLANNETGCINAVAELVRAAKAGSDALFHVDAVQAAGRVPVDLAALGADLASVCAHKIGGPVGIGALYVARDGVLDPQATGGGQEGGLRGGTENVAAAVGMAAALAAAARDMEAEATRLSGLRERLWQAVLRAEPRAWRNTPAEGTLPGTLNVSFPAASGQKIVRELDALGISASAGSACTSGGTSASHVIAAMTADETRRAGAVRFSMGWSTAAEDVDAVEKVLGQALAAAKAAEISVEQ